MSIQQTVNQGLTTAMGASALAQITQEQRINRKYENISSKAFGQALNELGGMEIKDISLEKQQKALKRIAERKEDIKNILLEKNPKKASEEKSINDFRYLQGLPPKGGK